MNEKTLFALIYITGVFISSVSQVILKKSAEKKYASRIREYLNFRVFFAYFIFLGATFCSVLAFSRIPLSLGSILESSGYFFVAVLSYIFLKEKISKQKMLGLSIIIIGIIIYAL